MSLVADWNKTCSAAGNRKQNNVNLLAILTPHKDPDLKPLRVAEGAGANPRLLEDLKAHGQCRYPVSDTPFLMCADACGLEDTYCGPHRALCLTPASNSRSQFARSLRRYL